jgi:DNA-binding MarR family transcriptional regulator
MALSSDARGAQTAPSTRTAPVHETDVLGPEARARHDDHAALKLWLRLLACTTRIESEIRRRLRARFGTSLARFDYMAQLYRHRSGLKMNALSRLLMVTGGNVTGLTDELEREALVVRVHNPADRRAWLVRLTPKGRRMFETMAREHERWVVELLGGLGEASTAQLHQALGVLRGRLLQLDKTEETEP